MSARTGRLFLAASLALAPGLLLAQDRAVPRGGGGGGGSGSGAGARQPSSSGASSSSSGGSSGSSSGYSSGGSSSGGYGSSTAEQRHPRAGTGSAYHPGYYPGYPAYGWGGYYPGYGGYWWPYAYSGWYGSGYWGYPGYGGAVYYSSTPNEGGSIRVLCDPAEARVYVDGYYAGVVDDFDGLFQRLHVAPGRHEITLKLEGYTSHRMRVYVGPDATVKLHHEMQRGTGETFEDLTGGAPPPEREVRSERSRDQVEAPAPAPPEEPRPAVEDRPGRLNLRVQPEDASVYIDGAFRGNGREAGTLRLAPGRHRIEVVRPGFRTSEQDFEVAPGEPTQLSITLERPQL